MRTWISTFLILNMAAMLATMVACGGGGGGSTSLNESVNYSGETLPAVIDTTSAVQLALDSTIGTQDADEYGGGIYGGMLFFLGATENGVSGVTSGLDLARNPAKAVNLVRDYMDWEVPAQPLSVSGESLAEPLGVQCMSQIMDTGLSGSVTLKVCANPSSPSDTRYWFSMTLIFDEFDDGTQYLDGELEVQGILDETIGPDGDIDGPITLVFRDLVTMIDPNEENSEVDGWVIYDDEGTFSANYNLCITDNISGKSFWMDDYTIILDPSNDEVTLSGRFYNSITGYVDLTTESVISWNLDVDLDGNPVFVDDHPTAGTVKLTGADGYWVSISFSVTGFTVQVNYTGDDTADITLPSIGEYPWV